MGYFFSTLFLSSRCLSTQEKVPRSGIQIKPNHFGLFSSSRDNPNTLLQISSPVYRPYKPLKPLKDSSRTALTVTASSKSRISERSPPAGERRAC